VIKDFADMGNRSNSLYKALLLDTNNVPAGRVYELQQADGTLSTIIRPPLHTPTVIVGSDPTMVVNNKNAASPPPLISGYAGMLSNTGYISAGGDLTIEIVLLLPVQPISLWAGHSGSSAPNLHLVYDNCIFEHVRWVFVDVYSENCDVTLRNCYFVNMNGQPCRRNGGLFDCFANLDTLLVENCTHINAQGTMYRFRSGWQFKRIISIITRSLIVRFGIHE